MSIIPSCILLGGASFLATHGVSLAEGVETYMGNVRERGMLLLMPPLDLILMAFPQEGAVLLMPALQVMSAKGGQPATGSRLFQ